MMRKSFLPKLLFLAILAALTAAALTPSSALAAEGNFLWTRSYNSGYSVLEDNGKDVAVDSAGNLYVVGTQAVDEATNGKDVFIRKYNSVGDFLWMATYNSGGGTNDYAEAITIDSAGYIYVTGGSGPAVNSRRAFVLKYDSSGTFINSNTTFTGSDAVGMDIGVGSNSDIYVAGHSWNGGKYDIFIWRFNSSLVLGNTSSYNSGGVSCYAYALAFWSSGPSNYMFVAGYKETNNSDILVLGYSNLFPAFQWAQLYNSSGTNDDKGFAVATSSDGFVYVGGRSVSTMTVLKYTIGGVFQGVTNYGTLTGSRASDMVIDSNNKLYIVGDYFNGTNYDAFLEKYLNQWRTPLNPSGGNIDFAFGGVKIGPTNSNYYVTGSYSQGVPGGQYMFLAAIEGAIPPPPPPTVNLSAFPTTINSGESTTLSWTTTDATVCDDVPLPEWLSGPVGTAGSEVEWPTATTTYTISCTGPGGTTQQSTTVTVNATCGEGSLTWTQTYNSGGSQSDLGLDVVVDSSGNIYITGYQTTNGQDMFLRKYDSTGAFQWMQTYNSGGTQADRGRGTAVDSNGNIYVSGTQGTNGGDMFLQKYDSAGTFQWTQSYNSGSSQVDLGEDVAVDLGGNIYVTGYEQTSSRDMFLRKYDSSGAFQWMQTYNSGGVQSDYGYDVAVDSGGNIYVTGYQQTNGEDMFLRKYDSSGAFQWMQTYNSGGSQWDEGHDVAVDSGGNIYIIGDQATNGYDVFLRKYNSSGAFQWMQTYNSVGTQSDYGKGIAVDSAGNIYIAGDQATNGYDIFLRKYDSSGAFQWMQTYNSGGTNADLGADTIVDSSNNINVVGSQQTNGYDMVLLQYDGSGCGFTPAPTVNLSANPSTINGGEYSDLTWNSTNAVSCAAVYPVGWTSQTGTSGTERLYPASTTIYTILCTGAGGTTYQATTVTVNAPPAGADCGLRMFDGTSTIILDCENPASTSPLRIYNNGTISGIKLVDPADANASRFRIAVPDGGGGTVIKALRKQ